MLFVTGDIHGSAFDLEGRLMELADRLGRALGRNDELLLLGDVGMKYGWKDNPDLLSVMADWGVTFVVMRGNHDARYARELRSGDFGNGFAEAEWRGGPVLVDGRADNVLYVPDEGALYGNDGDPFLVIPGAFSVDMEYRIAARLPYEPDEQLTHAEMDRIVGLSEGGGIGHVFSHTCPDSWLPLIDDLMMPGVDQSRVDKTMERMMDVVLDNVSDGLRGWWFGHYHDDRDIDGTGGIGHMLHHGVRAVEGF